LRIEKFACAIPGAVEAQGATPLPLPLALPNPPLLLRSCRALPFPLIFPNFRMIKKQKNALQKFFFAEPTCKAVGKKGVFGYGMI
jgi:hypothetical protein